MAVTKPLFAHTAAELARRIAAREVSSREVVEAHLARIDAVNPAVNAVTAVLAETALAAADAADRTPPAGPLHGVPFTVKENLDLAGSPTTHGVTALRNALPYQDAPVVARMKAAGAIPIARTNLPEYALRLHTSNPYRGATLNPWNPKLTPGGSSGGDAAALATGMAPLGLGNDLGGSLRNPAYCCGVAALKPTTGRIARAASLPPLDFGFASQYMAVDGPLARSAADLRLALAVLAGRDARDPRSVDAPLAGPPAPKRAGLVTHIPGYALPAAVQGAVRRAGRILADAGWEIASVEAPALDQVNGLWLDLIAADFTEMMDAMRPTLSPATTAYMHEVCRRGSGATSYELQALRSSLIRLWSEFFTRTPVLVGPVWPCLPWPAEADLAPGGVDLVIDTLRFITPGNALGLPAVVVPTGVEGGLPMGVQIYADLWREDLCLEAACAIEQAVDMPTPIDPPRQA